MMTREIAERTAVAALALAGVAAWAIVPTYPDVDAYHHLVWGRGLLEGTVPHFEEFWAPTPHPLYLVLAALLSLAGDDADRLLVLVAVLSFVALLAGVYTLGRELFGAPAGVVGAIFVGSSSALHVFASHAFVDIPFLALLVWAGALESRRVRRGASAMALLMLAGLLRPEAWILSGLYWLWCLQGRDRRHRAALLALAVAPPTLWALIDLAVTGDPLFSLMSTRDQAGAMGRERGLQNVPSGFTLSLVALTGPVVVGAGLAGLVLALRRYGPRRMVIPIALLGTGTLAYVGIGVAGLSLIPRYLTVPAVALCVLAGYALASFMTLPASGRGKHIIRVVMGVVAVGMILLVPMTSRPEIVRGEVRLNQREHAELTQLLAERQVREGIRCGALTFPTYRLVPKARWLLRTDSPNTIRSRALDPAPGAVSLYVTGGGSLERLFGRAPGVPRSTNRPPAADPTVVRGMFEVYVACPDGNAGFARVPAGSSGRTPRR